MHGLDLFLGGLCFRAIRQGAGYFVRVAASATMGSFFGPDHQGTLSVVLAMRP